MNDYIVLVWRILKALYEYNPSVSLMLGCAREYKKNEMRLKYYFNVVNKNQVRKAASI